jgi:hypothetical protein
MRSVLSNSEKVDSVFTKYFTETEIKIRNRKSLSKDEQQFFMLASFMAGTIFYNANCFSPNTITTYQLTVCKKWYGVNQNKISWLKLKRGFQILNQPNDDAGEAELEALKIR